MPVKYGAPAAGAAAGLGGAGAASAFGAASKYKRFGGSVLPFAMGAFAGTAAYSLLSSNPSARCNGVRPECYRDFCAQAAKSCAPADGKPLKLARCPSSLSSRFTECWATNVRLVAFGFVLRRRGEGGRAGGARRAGRGGRACLYLIPSASPLKKTRDATAPNHAA